MTDGKLERTLAVLLRTGVLVAGGVVLAGGVLYVTAHGGEPADYHSFVPISAGARAVLAGAWGRQAQDLIQLGVLLLIATPVLRVAFSLAGFALEGDRKYVAITSLVLALLLWSLASG